MSASNDERLRRSAFLDGSAHSSPSSSASFFSFEEDDDDALFLTAVSIDDPHSDQSSTTAACAAVASSIGLSPVPKVARKETPTPPSAPNPPGSSGSAGEINTEPRVLSERSRSDRNDLTSSSPNSEPPETEQKGDLQARKNLQSGPSTKVPLDRFLEKVSSRNTHRKLSISIANRSMEKGIVGCRTRRQSLEVPSSSIDDAANDGNPINVFESLEMLLPKEDPNRIHENVDVIDIAKAKELDINLTPSWWRPGGYDAEIPKIQKEQSERLS